MIPGTVSAEDDSFQATIFYLAFPSDTLNEGILALSAEAENARVIESEVKGTTLRVYWGIFKSSRPLGVREVQRLIRFSSPSTALYHLEKLRELGVARKDEHGRYEVVEEIRPSQFRMFLRIGRIILPRFVFYAVFFVAAVVMYLLQSLVAGSEINVMALVFGSSASLVCVYEAIRIWRDKIL